MTDSRHLFIAGAQKGGTSTLSSWLMRHPQVVAARDPKSKQVVKEVHFIDNHWDRGIDWYRSHYAAEQGIHLDSTPNYMCRPLFQKRLATHFPDAKLIVTLRNPIDRAFSAYNHYVQEMPQTKLWDWGMPGQSFDENVQAELAQPFKPWMGLVGRGHYIHQIESLLQRFSRDQLLVIVLEQWSGEKEKTAEQILQFLELPSMQIDIYPTHVRPYSVEPMLPETFQRLTEVYLDSNERLFNWLGYDIPQWSHEIL